MTITDTDDGERDADRHERHRDRPVRRALPADLRQRVQRRRRDRDRPTTAPGVRVPPTMSLMKSFWMRTLPPSLTISSRMPWNNRTLASVTTNDGIPTLATMNPVNMPSSNATTERREQRGPSAANRRPDASPAPPPTTPRREAGGEVDVAQQQDERDRHGDDDHRRRLVEEVGEVEQRQEGVGSASPKMATSTMIARIAGSDPRSPPRPVTVLWNTSRERVLLLVEREVGERDVVSTMVTPGVGSSGIAHRVRRVVGRRHAPTTP